MKGELLAIGNYDERACGSLCHFWRGKKRVEIFIGRHYARNITWLFSVQWIRNPVLNFHTLTSCNATHSLSPSFHNLGSKPHLYPGGSRGLTWCGSIVKGIPHLRVSVVPFRSNTVSPLKSPRSVRVKSGQVHIFQLHYLKRCGSPAK